MANNDNRYAYCLFMDGLLAYMLRKLSPPVQALHRCTKCSNLFVKDVGTAY